MHRVFGKSVQKLPGCQKPREMGTFPAQEVGNLGCQWCSEGNGAQDTEFVWSGLRVIAAGHKGDTVQTGTRYKGFVVASSTNNRHSVLSNGGWKAH